MFEWNSPIHSPIKIKTIVFLNMNLKKIYATIKYHEKHYKSLLKGVKDFLNKVHDMQILKMGRLNFVKMSDFSRHNL